MNTLPRIFQTPSTRFQTLAELYKSTRLLSISLRAGRTDSIAADENTMSYYNQQLPPVGVPPPQGYPEGYAKEAYPPPGYPVQGYPPPGYLPAGGYPPPQYAQPPPPQNQSSGPSFLEGCLAALCCCCLLDACF